jgi:hypothetical protein
VPLAAPDINVLETVAMQGTAVGKIKAAVGKRLRCLSLEHQLFELV